MKNKNLPFLSKVLAVTFFLMLTININVTAQSGEKWATGGNSASTGDVLGTTNNYPLLFTTNNAQKMMLSTAGVLQVNNLSGSGNRLLQTDASGNIIPFAMGPSTKVLYGDGSWGALPAIPSSLWNSSGSNVYFNSGNVGIGTSSPAFPLDVTGDARISNNLYVGGGIIITEKVNANAEVITGKMRADSIVTDSTKGFYGTSKFNGDVRLESKLSVNGNTLINGTATVNGDLKTMGSLTFAGDKKIGYFPGTGGGPSIFSFGFAVRPPGPCYLPTLTTASTVNQFQGLIESYDDAISTANVMTMGFDGANGIIDLAGGSGSLVPSRLLINYNCGKDVYVCTGALGGNMNICNGPLGGNVNICDGSGGGNVNICSGAIGGIVMANSLVPRVGIGTNSPLAKFDIQNADPALITASISKVEPGRIRRMIFEPKLNGGDYNYLTQPGDIGMFWSDGSPALSSETTGFVLAHWGGAGTGYPYSGLRMTKEGFIGIGTPSPEAMVDIQNGEYLGGTGARNPVGLKITSTYANNPTLGIGVLCQVGDDLSKTFSSGKTDGSVYTENFVVYGDGYVFARDIRVTLQTPFSHPDYVFEKNYNLMPLNKLEDYLKVNKHLPNIPSADDVEKNNGISLGEMSTKQLEKIEELTLYIIEMNKKINALENIVQIQREEMQLLNKK